MKTHKKILCIVPFVAMLLSCGGTPNKDKPLIFFNRQPSMPDASGIDHKTMGFSENTFYVGFDAIRGGDVQGQMILDYFKEKTSDEVDRNKDGKLGYVLAIGDEAHNDSRARTIGIRKALGTLVTDEKKAKENYKAGVCKVGEIQLKDKKILVEELASQVMAADDGAGWNADAAGKAFISWKSSEKIGASNSIDFAVSNNDGMAGGMRGSTAWIEGLPLFGYDANADALEAIKNGKMTGTVSQNVDAQAIGVLQLIRNIIDGEKGENVIKKGFSEPDKWGNKITPKMDYVEKDRAIMANNSAVTSINVDSYIGAKRDEGIKDITKQKDIKKIKVWLDLYNGSDNFLSASYWPALDHYQKLMNIEIHKVEGDGQEEKSVSEKFVNLGKYDAYAINMVKTNSGSIYTKKLH